MDLDIGWPLLAVTTAQHVTLPATEQAATKAQFLRQIQKYASIAVGPDDVLVRGTRIINTRPASFFGEFPIESVDEVAQLLPGRALMFEHNYGEPPEGKFFAAKRVFLPEHDLVPRKQAYWCESLWYVPNDEQGQATVRRIDLGIYGESSLAWAFLTAECSICGNDVRTMSCSHWPGEVYEAGGLCTFRMRKIVDVLEGSIVFAGAERGTHFFDPAQSAAASRGGVVIDKEKGTAQHLPPGSYSKAAFAQVSALASRYGRIDSVVHALAAKRETLGLEQADAPLTLEALFSGQAAAPARRSEPRRSDIQSVLCSRERYIDKADAARNVRELSFAANEPSESRDGWEFEQFEASACDRSSTAKVAIVEGMTGVACKRRSSGEASETGSASLESLFAGQ